MVDATEIDEHYYTGKQCYFVDTIGRYYSNIVMEAGEGMGKYCGTRWPMSGTFTTIDAHRHLRYDARSWTEGDENTTTIDHTNDITFTESGDTTIVRLHITIAKIGPKAKMAAFGMRWGYKAYLDKLDELLASS